MKVKAKILVACFFAVWSSLMTFSSQAQAASTNIESLMKSDRWKETSREIFLEAQSVENLDTSNIQEQARAGFLDDALQALAKMHANFQPDVLINIVNTVPSISKVQSVELLQKALDACRAMSMETIDYIKSGILTKIAFAYLKLRMETEARKIFSEALQAAKAGLKEKNTGGYKQMTGSMVQQTVSDHVWMILLVKKAIENEGKDRNSTFAYLDLSTIAARMNENALASELIDLGYSTVSAIERSSVRALANEKLSYVAIGIGYKKRSFDGSPFIKALHEVRSGNIQEGIAIAATLPSNMYVDHAEYTHIRIVDDALQRNDLPTAIYLLEHAVKPVRWTIAERWKRVAELQFKKGAKEDAAKNYLQARQIILTSSDNYYSVYDIRTLISIAASLRENGFHTEARQVINESLTLNTYLREYQKDARIEAPTLIADAAWRNGMYSEAKQLVVNAYQAAHSYSEERKSKKARMLSELGKTTSTFFKNPEPIKAKAKIAYKPSRS